MWEYRLVQPKPRRILYPRERSSNLPRSVGTSLPKYMQKFILVEFLTLSPHIQETPHSFLNLKTVLRIEIWRSSPHITQGNAVNLTESKPRPSPSTSLRLHHAQPWRTLREPGSLKGVFKYFKNIFLIPDTVSSDPKQLLPSQDENKLAIITVIEWGATHYETRSGNWLSESSKKRNFGHQV
jgi:hypothetical protein